MTMNIRTGDTTNIKCNTTPLRLGDKVAVSFPPVAGFNKDYTILDDNGLPKLYTVMADTNGELGIVFKVFGDNGLEEQFTPFSKFAYTVKFDIANR